jgi:hypothetical protein
MATWREAEKRLLLEIADKQVATMRCALCNWHWRGKVRDGREAFKAHRERRHP